MLAPRSAATVLQSEADGEGPPKRRRIDVSDAMEDSAGPREQKMDEKRDFARLRQQPVRAININGGYSNDEVACGLFLRLQRVVLCRP
jgi:hypothetical protein